MEPLGIVVFSCIMGTAGFSVILEVRGPVRRLACTCCLISPCCPSCYGHTPLWCADSHAVQMVNILSQAVRELVAGTHTHLPNAGFVIGAPPAKPQSVMCLVDNPLRYRAQCAAQSMLAARAAPAEEMD